MSDWLKKHHKAENVLENVYHELKHLSNCFYTTGNKLIGETLHDIAVDIHKSSTDMQKAVAESINEGLKTAENFTATILKGALESTIKSTEALLKKEENR